MKRWERERDGNEFKKVRSAGARRGRRDGQAKRWASGDKSIEERTSEELGKGRDGEDDKSARNAVAGCQEIKDWNI